MAKEIKNKSKKRGQTVVELLLILPVFMMMLFFILELGNIAYHTIVAHHAAYELARVGGLVAVRKQGGPTDRSRIQQKLKEMQTLMFKNKAAKLTFKVDVERTSKDPQSKTHTNEDVIVTLTYPVKLVFPGTSFIFADNPKRLGIRKVHAQVRMPIERPLLN
ncbi:TadE-like protein [Parelusimicrobium proximum]|uniref:TadE family protein n=1 Tax=Parelusimicrobium proximum TaxID=3228953 RepID=UPI003D16684F